MWICIIEGCSLLHILKGNRDSPGRLQVLLWSENGSGTRIWRVPGYKGQVRQEPRRESKKESLGRVEDQEQLQCYRSWLLIYHITKSVLEFCMNSAAILMVFPYDSLEVTKLGDIFNVLE